MRLICKIWDSFVQHGKNPSYKSRRNVPFLWSVQWFVQLCRAGLTQSAPSTNHFLLRNNEASHTGSSFRLMQTAEHRQSKCLLLSIPSQQCRGALHPCTRNIPNFLKIFSKVTRIHRLLRNFYAAFNFSLLTIFQILFTHFNPLSPPTTLSALVSVRQTGSAMYLWCSFRR